MRTDPDERLLVRSPFIGPCTKGKWQQMGDGARFMPNGGFELLPRVDHIFKVEDRRFSPVEMERRLIENRHIDDAAIVVLPQETKQVRPIVSAVLVPTTEGFTALRSIGRKKFVENLRRFLGKYFDAVLLPKRWRIVSTIPCDERGKRPLAILQRLFAIPQSDTPKLPSVITETQKGNRAAYTLHVPHDLRYFPGHFPDNPIVPGFVQIEWVMHFAKQSFPLGEPLCSVEALKFNNVLLPDSKFELEIEWIPQRCRLQFRLLGDTPHSSGRIQFRKAEIPVNTNG